MYGNNTFIRWSWRRPTFRRRPDHPQSARRTCKRCGFHEGFQHRCPARGCVCYRCGKSGHFARKCFSKLLGRFSFPRQHQTVRQTQKPAVIMAVQRQYVEEKKPVPVVMAIQKHRGKDEVVEKESGENFFTEAPFNDIDEEELRRLLPKYGGFKSEVCRLKQEIQENRSLTERIGKDMEESQYEKYALEQTIQNSYMQTLGIIQGIIQLLETTKAKVNNRRVREDNLKKARDETLKYLKELLKMEFCLGDLPSIKKLKKVLYIRI